eukprot:2711309-Pyramimonas_sp.AAC.1
MLPDILVRLGGGTGAFGGAPYGPMGLDTCEGCAKLSVGDACGRRHSGLRWSSLWGHGGHETCEGCAELGVVCVGRMRAADLRGRCLSR